MVFTSSVKYKGLELSVKFPWKVGIVLFMAFPETLKGEKVLESVEEIVSDDYFDVLEVPAYEGEVLRKIVKVAEERDVDVYLALQPEVLVYKANINSLDENERKRAVERIKEKLNIAANAGIKNSAICSGPTVSPADSMKAKESLVKSFVEMLSEAEKLGMSLLLETFDVEYDKRLLIGPLREGAEVIRRLREEHGFKNTGLLWDLSHAPLLNEKPEDLKEFADVLSHIHIGCAKSTDEGLKDWHPGFYTPGAINTVEDVAKLIEVLYEIGYKGAISFEIKPEAQQTSLEVINASKGVLMQAFNIFLRRRILGE